MFKEQIEALLEGGVDLFVLETFSELTAIEQANRWAGQPLPISAAAWLDGVLRVRLSGAESAVGAGRTRLGGEEVRDGEAFWADLREHRLPYFRAGVPLWRLSMPQAAAPVATPHAQLVDWGGGQRWVSGELDGAAIRSAVEAAGGHATRFRNPGGARDVFHPLQPAIAKIPRSYDYDSWFRRRPCLVIDPAYSLSAS